LAEYDRISTGAEGAPNADSPLLLVWWFWLPPALMELPLPLRYFHAVCTRGWESVATTGIGGDGFAILGFTGLLTLYGLVPFLFLSALYAFLFFRRKRRGVKLSARFWIPIYGFVSIVAALSLLLIIASANARREHMPPNGWSPETVRDEQSSSEN
jgi:hypothetical protein